MRNALIVLLGLSAYLAGTGCGEDGGASAASAADHDAGDAGGASAPSAADHDAGDAGATSGSDAAPEFDNQDGLPEDSCADPEPGALPLWACVEREGASTVGGEVSFEGVVEEIVDGPWDCLGGWATRNIPGTKRFRVANGDESFWVGWTLPSELIELGDELSVAYRAELGQHSTAGNLVVNRSDGSLLGWLGKDFIDALDVPAGVHVERGGDACSYESDCGTVDLAGLQVEVFTEQQRVPYGASLEVGDYVVQGGDSRLTASKCLGAQSAGASIAVYARARLPTDADAGEP